MAEVSAAELRKRLGGLEELRQLVAERILKTQARLEEEKQDLHKVEGALEALRDVLKLASQAKHEPAQLQETKATEV